MKYFHVSPEDYRNRSIVHNVLTGIKCIEHVEGNVYRSVGFHADDIRATLRLHGVKVNVIRIDKDFEGAIHGKKGFKLI